MHMMKAIDMDMMMDGLVEENILVIILQQVQALVLLRRVVRQQQALVLQQAVDQQQVQAVALQVEVTI
jgi:hypothetical protein